MSDGACDVYTIGFSNRTWEETLEILSAYGIQMVADIRTLPGSRYAPQFNQEHLAAALPQAGIGYIHLKQLGGLRKPAKDDSTNAGWRNAAFRGYADHMRTAEFLQALERLTDLLHQAITAFACTEAVFWRCHRSLVADALTIRGIRVCHIFSATKCSPHRLTSFARVDELRITYPETGEP
jgi:uncharacterized protein (DUF488 family)